MIRVAVPRDLRRPWRRLTATLRRRAARGRTAGIDTTAEWPTGSRGPAGHAASARARVPEAA
jgi:hypothetical protein